MSGIEREKKSHGRDGLFAPMKGTRLQLARHDISNRLNFGLSHENTPMRDFPLFKGTFMSLEAQDTKTYKVPLALLPTELTRL